MTRTPIPSCPQPETPIRERAWAHEQIAEIKATARRELVEQVNAALKNVPVPNSLTPSRAEYYKAGARACIKVVNAAIGATP